MADSASRTQRASAMEEKRRRLDELKKRKSQRSEDTAKVKANASANLEDYIDGLLSEPAAGTPTPPTDRKTAETSEGSTAETQAGGADATASSSSKPSDTNNVIAEPAPAPPQRTVETFTMGTQTEDDDFPEPPEMEQDEDDAAEEREKRAGGGEEDLGEVPVVQQTLEEKDPKLLSAEELEKQVTSALFSSFINTASKKVERLLGTPMLSELLVDYVGETDGVQRSDNKDSDGSRFLSSRQVYECSKWTAGRDVTDMDWSPLHRDFILSTYHMPSSTLASSPLSKGSAAVSAISPNGTLSSSLTPRSGELQSDGLALVWSLSMPTRPEHIFTCGSPVTTGRFHPTESTLVIGGCESGQLVVWDVRAGRLPVQKSALATVAGASSKGHMHPICSMEMIEGSVSYDIYVSEWGLVSAFPLRLLFSDAFRFYLVGTVWTGDSVHGRTCELLVSC
jgi:dynein intermediate chain